MFKLTTYSTMSVFAAAVLMYAKVAGDCFTKFHCNCYSFRRIPTSRVFLVSVPRDRL